MNGPNPSRTQSPDPVDKLRTQCSFCGRISDVAGPMVEGPNAIYICADCVEIAYGIVLTMRGRERIKAQNPRVDSHPG
jgi:ATP-dependent Clp protease ATP-binding subunit ClpX